MVDLPKPEPAVGRARLGGALEENFGLLDVTGNAVALDAAVGELHASLGVAAKRELLELLNVFPFRRLAFGRNQLRWGVLRLRGGFLGGEGGDRGEGEE